MFLKEESWGSVKFPGITVIKNLPANAGDAGDTGPIPGLERSPGGGNGKLFHNSCWDSPVDRGAWRATVRGVLKSQMRVRD